MKVKLIRTYVKNVEQKDENGLPLVDQFGRVIKQLKDMFLYGIVDASADEKDLYRTFRTQDGEDYYRERMVYHCTTATVALAMRQCSMAIPVKTVLSVSPLKTPKW